jgi:hypothetical protein
VPRARGDGADALGEGVEVGLRGGDGDGGHGRPLSRRDWVITPSPPIIGISVAMVIA